MKYILIAMSLTLSITVFAQQKAKPVVFENLADSPAYKRNPHFPVFSLLLTDSTHYTNQNIPKGKPTVIVYFSPDCSHCQADAKNMMDKLDSLKDINFVWCSSHEPEKIKEFAVKYNMFGLPNMVFGKDEKYAIPSFFKISFTPYFAVYSKEGLFHSEFRNGLLPKDIIDAVAQSNIKKKKEVTPQITENKLEMMDNNVETPIEMEVDKVYTAVEVEASFPGGDAAWHKYLTKYLNGNVPGEHNAPPGRYTVTLNFVVDKNGAISNITANDPGYGTKQEAIRVLKNSPKWNPGIQNGRNVKSWRRQSITFDVAKG
jgi:thiol-disulfide isomerase/thioredoxin